jgi:RNA polymerase sigma-70 factor (ECF subfamily)
MLERESDEELMARVASGDQPAFRRLMALHMGRAIRVAETVVRHAGEADDIAQEAFIRIWRSAGSFDPGRARFTTWMHRIVVNLAIDRRRRAGGEAVEITDDIPLDEVGALDALIAAEQQRALQVALTQLPERQRVAIALFHFEGISGRASAEALNLSESAFDSLLTRARNTLKHRVRELLRGTGRQFDEAG